MLLPWLFYPPHCHLCKISCQICTCLVNTLFPPLHQWQLRNSPGMELKFWIITALLFQSTHHFVTPSSITPCKVIWIHFSFWNPESLESGIQVLLTSNPESSTWNPECTAWNPQSKTVLDYPTWRELCSVSLCTTTLHPHSCTLTKTFPILFSVWSIGNRTLEMG